MSKLAIQTDPLSNSVVSWKVNPLPNEPINLHEYTTVIDDDPKAFMLYLINDIAYLQQNRIQLDLTEMSREHACRFQHYIMTYLHTENIEWYMPTY